MIDKFNQYIQDQMTYGGQKYALNNQREATDMLFEVFSQNWLFGTMAKYCYRYGNLSQEKELLKIACYCYILWLKKGFHIKRDGLKVDVLDTVVEVKSQNFGKFLGEIKKSVKGDSANLYSDPTWTSEMRMTYVLNTLGEWSVTKWEDIKEKEILNIYHQCYIVWRDRFLNAPEHNTDTGKKRVKKYERK